MVSSTAPRVAYDLRPSKQVERRLFLAYLEICKECGLKVSDFRYVGLGGFKFYDFLLLYKYAGIDRMVSLEHDRKVVPRCKFNNPFGFIKIFGESVSMFLSTEEQEEETIYWFDYDSPLTESVIEDINVLGQKAKAPSLTFVTVNAEVPNYFSDLERERLEMLEEMFGDLAGGIDLEDCENAFFHRALFKILTAAFMNAFAPVTDARLMLNFAVTYADGARMLTVGGVFCEQERIEQIADRCNRKLSFLFEDINEPFWIRQFNLSERERYLMEYAASVGVDSDEREQLNRIGISDNLISHYSKLLGYIPRYFESAI